MGERRGKRQVLLRPGSKVVVKFLTVMMKHGYIGEFEVIDDHRGSKIVVNLNGRINKCGVISPRFDVKLKDVEKWSSYLLPSRQFWFHCSDNICRYNGPRGDEAEEHGRKDSRILLLKHNNNNNGYNHVDDGDKFVRNRWLLK